MKKLFSIVAAVSVFTSAAVAQEMKHCGLDELRKKLIQDNPSAEYEMQQYEDNLTFITEHYAGKSTAMNDTIPVVFHIVLNQYQVNLIGGPAGIATRCASQIAALNRDFNAANSDSTMIPAAFKPLYANANIHFGLAHRTPTGEATPGFTIDTVTVTGFDPNVQGNVGSGYICSDAKYSNNGGADGWDPQKYLNVWVVNTAPGGTQGGFTAGIAMHPSMINQFPLNERGVVIHMGTFGQKQVQNQYFINSLDSGRVLVHEIGHYLGLWHTWGTDQGGCQWDDGIADTPPQDYSTQSYCPTFPLTDQCSPNYPGVMYMNYMDYATETCQHMFTHGQVARFNSVTANTYPQLVTHPELIRYPEGTAVSTVSSSEPTFTVSPNPAKNTTYVNVGEKANDVQRIMITNGIGQVVNTINGEVGRTIYNIDLGNYATGMYFIQCQFNDGNKEIQKLLVN